MFNKYEKYLDQFYCRANVNALVWKLKSYHFYKCIRDEMLLLLTTQKQKSNMLDISFNLEGNVLICKDKELGDGANSRIYLGTVDTQQFAVKCLKDYLPHHACALVESYEKHSSIVSS